MGYNNKIHGFLQHYEILGGSRRTCTACKVQRTEPSGEDESICEHSDLPLEK